MPVPPAPHFRRGVGARRIFARAPWRSIAAVIAALGTVATVVAVSADLLPDSSPCPEDKATLGTPTLDEGKLRRFLTTISPPAQNQDPTDGYTEAQLNTSVKWLSVPVEVQGHRGDELTLTWSVGESESAAAVTLTSDKCASSGLQHLLLDPPVPAGRTRLVRVVLLSDTGSLAEAPRVRVAG